MYTWFECRIRYEKIVDGKMKKVTEPYLIEAYSYTEAEARIIKELTPFISGEYSITNIKRAKIAEIFPDETGDRWYTCKINIILLDEGKGIEKKVAVLEKFPSIILNKKQFISCALRKNGLPLQMN